MKSLLQNLFIAVTALVAMGIIGLACTPNQQHNGGTCTYEGLECPTALNQYLIDSVKIDSLTNVIDSLETNLAACQLDDHSKLQQMVDTGVLHLTRDERGLISVIYREPNGNEYALDYITDAAFYAKFGYQAAK